MNGHGVRSGSTRMSFPLPVLRYFKIFAKLSKRSMGLNLLKARQRSSKTTVQNHLKGHCSDFYELLFTWVIVEGGCDVVHDTWFPGLRLWVIIAFMWIVISSLGQQTHNSGARRDLAGLLPGHTCSLYILAEKFTPRSVLLCSLRDLLTE